MEVKNTPRKISHWNRFAHFQPSLAPYICSAYLVFQFFVSVKVLSYALRLTPYALRLTPYALRLTPYALRITDYISSAPSVFEIHQQGGSLLLNPFVGLSHEDRVNRTRLLAKATEDASRRIQLIGEGYRFPSSSSAVSI